MSKELKITKEKVLEASESCPDAKEVLKTLFPSVFKDEWRDVTLHLTAKIENFLEGRYFIKLYDGSKQVAYTHTNGENPILKLADEGKDEYKIEWLNNSDFRILQKE